MIITNVEEYDLENIFQLQGAVFQEEPLLTHLDYFKEVISLDDLSKSFNKYDFLFVYVYACWRDGKPCGRNYCSHLYAIFRIVCRIANGI